MEVEERRRKEEMERRLREEAARLQALEETQREEEAYKYFSIRAHMIYSILLTFLFHLIWFKLSCHISN